MGRTIGRLNRGLENMGNAIVGALAISLLKLLRLTNPDKMADVSGWLMSRIGPFLPENRVGRANLTAAFPQKAPAEVEEILRGVWDNIGRMAAEFAHLDRLSDFDPWNPQRPARIEAHQDDIDRFFKLLHSGKPALVFAAHFANWELPAVCAAACKINSAVLYRRPNIPAIDKWLHTTRSATMGMLIPTGLDAPVRLADALGRGIHVGMLVDQYYSRGVDVTFFGRRTKANPLLARLARHFDCPIHGTRIVRLPGHRFRAELTEQVKPVRDAEGRIDVAGTTQAITTVTEGWIREYPDQWLWLHRRWRPEDHRAINDRS
ncbi:MAG TPA: lipid A biosynthesis lauroyl acyltransferase [Pseudolabrys sp.]|nr:lipid A biosynthesis lauroyl acyltransferase [Pseudolabrys sp.]